MLLVAKEMGMVHVAKPQRMFTLTYPDSQSQD